MAAQDSKEQLMVAMEAFIGEREAELDELRRMYAQLKDGAESPRRLEPRQDRSRPRERRGVGQHWIDATRDYLKKNKKVRQVQIAADLRANSGTISLALRALEDAGEARKAGVENRAQVWEWTGKPARMTNVHVGNGVEEGRLAKT